MSEERIFVPWKHIKWSWIRWIATFRNNNLRVLIYMHMFLYVYVSMFYVYIYVFSTFYWMRNLLELLIFTQVSANLHGECRQGKFYRVILLNRGSMPRKRTGRKWCKFSRSECATSQRDVTQDCTLIGWWP